MTSETNQILEAKFAAAPVVPLIEASDPRVAVATAKALQAGGLDVVEVVLRTDAALDCMAAIIAETSGITVGAGTILTVADAKAAAARGGQFIVSPGLVDAVVHFCKEEDLPVFPGTMTPGEVQQAHNLGLGIVKFFPAKLAGGVPMLKALSSVFRDMRFMPTGGVSADNLGEFLAVPSVIACGGSWLTPKAAIEAGDYDAITSLAREAVALARAGRS
ncbi:bifunctional 4-hydroxy-2-oxoglutarate aldolase/2-dehydro-3-deoxy-phosphogluconate aldolase [Sphingorhabdus sp. 109]|jgi:2-dehydro-3-deoxyphosphogluconate aldolase/(4S)-4-hydroxy-2-oxoglutarate aldolase|uniref:bifunctional 4-hydroxy-2-oxoglutarate aldolase/2-dehydro-3-deoxy-phosphogluconate aldolase n=1 Tax=Sphingorhabdus sp. 109 TaxID=2653173 RepID=UPI0012F2BB58|nr:bifunctional 4-hydroxy-2-oxoglutarate aldolase/2-dehydro-3-deoxy-phosphogluconate aldolase [Sphingorhabdus sp. 109]VWX62108.1 4-hydroxy-2-oxoglutarate aldolase / 2-dehydro-3-deoxy-phosphogluconate aldolase [Sphingorhabdus sp. 109]